ncbi:wax ester synthase/diacylglycerol acyltransferase 2-like [Euphorbia lathyris]|uniref:wax ester synthase/diacylglycerol acyltransferase 2-like n=1 Tax=Euphorbia lathyris TaxID=212925 RepID=UPI003314360D
MGNFSDEPLSPAARLMVHPTVNSTIHCALGLKNSVDINALKSTIKNSLMVTHPRFCSLLSRDKSGREYWIPSEIDIDRHIIIVDKNSYSAGDTTEKIAHDYVADLCVGTKLSSDKPLWEIHVLEKCLVFRLHHALGDGMSLMSMLLANCRKAEDPEAVPTLVAGGGRRDKGRAEKKKRSLIRTLIGFIQMVFFTLIFTLEFVARCLWISDRKTVISGGDGVEMWPRKIVNAMFLIKHMKMVKEVVGDATINDVLIGVISAGLSRYFDHRSPNSLKEGDRITGIAMVNLREKSGLQDVREMMKKDSKCRWGNEIGTVLVPIYYQKGIKPLQYVKSAKELTKLKKRGPVAYWSHKCRNVSMSLAGMEIMSWVGHKFLCQTTFTISNVIGPQEKITIAGNPITFIRVNLTSSPQALAMNMVSYAGKADLQILVAKDIIPDPEFLAKCFEDCLLEMKEAASTQLPYK